MSIIRTSSLSDFTRGGQTMLHFLRMISQVFSKLILFIILSWIVFFVGFYFLNSTSYERYVTGKWLMTRVGVELSDHNQRVPFDLPNGKTVQVKMGGILSDTYILETLQLHKKRMIIGAILSALLVIISCSLILYVITRSGSRLRKEKRLRGGRITTSRQLDAQLRFERRASDIEVASVPLLKGSETSHILITGSPGSGKSLAIRDLLDGIRDRGERAIVYSTSSEFIENYYRESQDTILNPVDERCPVWNIWSECHSPTDYDQVAASLITESNDAKDPFFNKAAQTLFSVVAQKMAKSGNPRTVDLLKTLLTIDLEELNAVVEGTEAAPIIDASIEKTAMSVRATLAAFVRSFKYLKNGQSHFSIRDWVNKDNDDSWVFMASRPDQKQSLCPLITMWLDIAAASILSLEPDQSRRIWIVIDELPSLNKLTSLSELLAMGRKYGACCVLSFQSYAQLCDTYGRNGAEEMVGLCSTWLLYRANEPVTAEWASKALGNVENMESHEGLSYGANEIRDGINLSMTRQIRPLVLATEMLNLPDRHGFIRLPGDWPIGRFEIPFKPRAKIAPSLIPFDYTQTAWSAFDQMPPTIQKVERAS